jgi:Holliday junction DNA helicase RuvB
VTLPITKSALELAAIDGQGLDDQDRQFLRTVIEVYDGGPVGIEAVAATMGEERDTLEDVIEPYLLQNAFVTRTRQGRRATKVAYEHLGLKWKPPRQVNGDGSLFDAAEGADDGGGREEETREVANNDRKDDRKPRGTR